MTTKVSKWGNSLGLRLPKNLIDDLNLRDGTAVKISRNDNKIIIEPKQQDLTMDELLNGMTKEKVISGFHSIESVGKEKFWEDGNT